LIQLDDLPLGDEPPHEHRFVQALAKVGKVEIAKRHR
jgi:hypothetical protein